MEKTWTIFDDTPETMSFDELIVHPLYYNYYEQNGTEYILLLNGWGYRKSRHDPEVFNRCRPDQKIDPVTIG